MTRAACAVVILNNPNATGFNPTEPAHSNGFHASFLCPPTFICKQKVPLVERNGMYLKHQTRTTLRSPICPWGEDEKNHAHQSKRKSPYKYHVTLRLAAPRSFHSYCPNVWRLLFKCKHKPELQSGVLIGHPLQQCWASQCNLSNCSTSAVLLCTLKPQISLNNRKQSNRRFVAIILEQVLRETMENLSFSNPTGVRGISAFSFNLPQLHRAAIVSPRRGYRLELSEEVHTSLAGMDVGKKGFILNSTLYACCTESNMHKSTFVICMFQQWLEETWGTVIPRIFHGKYE